MYGSGLSYNQERALKTDLDLSDEAQAASAEFGLQLVSGVASLESPIVFVMGTHRMCEAEQSVRLSEEPANRADPDNTRKLYMAFTRAGQRLAITYVGELPELFRRLHNQISKPASA
jgi:superfamily I DNA/RNA helicase